MIDKGADVLYAERFGISNAAKERKLQAIGKAINTQKDYPTHRGRLGAVWRCLALSGAAGLNARASAEVLPACWPAST